MLCAAAFSLSGCVANATNDKTIKIPEQDGVPNTVSTYDYQGQKVDQLKVKNTKIKSDSKIDTAINVVYSQNKVIHANNPLLIYNHITNFADQYDENLANKHYVDPEGNAIGTYDKSKAVSGIIYGMFENKFPSDGTVVVVKSKSGAPIGIFAGHVVSLKNFGNTDNDNALITLDGHEIFIYNAAYTLYPISAMKSMYQDKVATGISHQAGIKTKTVEPPAPDNGGKSNKK